MSLTCRTMALHTVRGSKPKGKRKAPLAVPFFRRAVRRRVQAAEASGGIETAPRQGIGNDEEELDQEEGDEEEGDEAEGDEDQQDEDDSDSGTEEPQVEGMPGVQEDMEEEEQAYEHLGVLGAGAICAGAATTSEFMIHYKGDAGSSVQENCFLLHVEDFEAGLVNPPDTSRVALQWDARVVKRQLIFLYGKRGYTGWYDGTVTAYDAQTRMHCIQPSDGTADITVDLLACKASVISEWRFLLDSENAEEVCQSLNQ